MRPPALAVAVLALVAAGCGEGSEGAALAPGRNLATARSLTPPVHLFADTVTARVDVTVDREALDPDRVRLRLSFLPYRIVGGLQHSRRDLDRFTRLSWEAELRCITIACMPPRHKSALGAQEGRGERRTFRFKPARVLYDDPTSGKLVHLRRVWWPPLDGVSRLSAGAPLHSGLGFGAGLEATLAPVAEPSYRLPAPLLGGLLLAGVAALLALPAGLGARALGRRRPPARTEPALAPLERALRLVEWARDESTRERRDALERLAFELDAEGEADRATMARRLAWSPEEPAPESVSELVESVRRPDGSAA